MPQRGLPLPGFWTGGDEGADHVRQQGLGLDMAQASGHVDRLDEDHRRAAQAGLPGVRESIGGRLAEAPGGAIDRLMAPPSGPPTAEQRACEPGLAGTRSPGCAIKRRLARAALLVLRGLRAMREEDPRAPWRERGRTWVGPAVWLIAVQAAWAPAVCAAPAQAAAAAQVADDSLSPQARDQLAWIRQTADNQGTAFAIIDKRLARLWLFDASGAFASSTAVLLGAARGDHSVPGIGERPMAEILPHERTTPAGRFVAEAGRNTKGDDIFWIDYDTAVSMHRVRPNVASERRLERLASATPEDNRISYGCINVPVNFFDRVLRPAFSTGQAVVYVLPETTPAVVLVPPAKNP